MSGEGQAAARVSAAAIAGLLPPVLRAGAVQDGPMAGLVDAMSAMLAPRAELIDDGAQTLQPLTAPERLLPWIAHVFGYGCLFQNAPDLAQGFPTGAARLRQFLANFEVLHHLRGTTEGLRLALTLATGESAIGIEEDAERLHLAISAPASLRPHREWLGRLIAAERPAHLTWSLNLDERATDD